MSGQIQVGTNDADPAAQNIQSDRKMVGDHPIFPGISRNRIREQSGSNAHPIGNRIADTDGPASYPSGDSKKLSLIGTMLKQVLNVLVKLGWIKEQTAQNLLAHFLVVVKNELDRSWAAMPESFQETPGVAAFNDLNICQTPEQKATLNALISRLQAKNPDMLTGIFDNCQWLKGKAQDDFIYSVAVASMQMELADIFDQTGFDSLPNGMQPSEEIMLGTTLLSRASIIRL